MTFDICTSLGFAVFSPSSQLLSSATRLSSATCHVSHWPAVCHMSVYHHLSCQSLATRLSPGHISGVSGVIDWHQLALVP